MWTNADLLQILAMFIFELYPLCCSYQAAELPQNSNIRRALVGNKLVDHWDVVGASPVSAAPTTSSFSTWHLDWAKTTERRDENHFSFVIWCDLYQICYGTPKLQNMLERTLLVSSLFSRILEYCENRCDKSEEKIRVIQFYQRTVST